MADFYSQSHWGTTYHVIDQAHPNPPGHQGLDIIVPGGSQTPVPLLRAGTLVKVDYSSAIGHYFVIQVAASDFDGYAHQRAIGGSVGTQYAAGTVLSATASATDGVGTAWYHGSAWGGSHLHFTNSAVVGGNINGNNRDPAPVINTVLGMPPNSAPIPTPEEDEMIRIVSYTSSNSRNGIYLAAPGYWHQFSPEEWTYWSSQNLFQNIQVVTPSNDHAFDLLHDIYTKTAAIATV